MANLNSLTRKGQEKKTRVGRGGKRGKTSGRGTKGQNARAGNKKRPELRDIIKKLPKRRGYGKNRGRGVIGSRPDDIAISLARLSSMFEGGAEVSVQSFIDHGIINKKRGMFAPRVKIVAGSDIDKKLSLKGIAVTAGARSAIEKAGGSIN